MGESFMSSHAIQGFGISKRNARDGRKTSSSFTDFFKAPRTHTVVSPNSTWVVTQRTATVAATRATRAAISQPQIRHYVEFERAFEPAVIDFTRTRFTELHETPSEDVQAYVLRVLSLLSDDSTVFPSLSPDDDGGAILTWKCGPLSLQVDVAPGGLFYVRRRDAATGALREWFDGPFPYPQVKSALREISRRVAEVNPAWRQAHG
jgi:hypothetical protein